MTDEEKKLLASDALKQFNKLSESHGKKLIETLDTSQKKWGADFKAAIEALEPPDPTVALIGNRFERSVESSAESTSRGVSAIGDKLEALNGALEAEAKEREKQEAKNRRNTLIATIAGVVGAVAGVGALVISIIALA